ncbi:ATP-dependent DNA ligase [uncultured Amnibacterium sp.]|uniref:ATP-dependent DNA ligase n=1 Tax=uncultured Amnibacterium sp. TaxID=1631851 RepID=UPI0035CBAE84
MSDAAGGQDPTRSRQTVLVGGRRLAVTHLDKVLYPETGWTKADVLDYYSRVADALIPLIADRAATRKRWVDGVGTARDPGTMFFAKNMEQGAPAWIARREIEHSSRTTLYPLVNDLPTLMWLGQMSTLELHAPQWRFHSDGTRANPDRLVLDLDPGEGVGLAECAEVARAARTILTGMGLDALPVTSGSKGIHLYSPLDGNRTADEISAVAHELARALEADHPDLIVSDMKKSLRAGKVLVDWSQNNGSKTTIVPYSLRGTVRPAAAGPRTWRELAAPDLRQLEPHEVLDRLDAKGDLLAPLHAAAEGAEGAEGADSAAGAEQRLAAYRGMRSADRTPEPGVEPGETRSRPTGDSFVIQEHHARRLHWDFRLERDGVLVSWALPKGVPQLGGKNHLAVHTEDHPLDYGSFEGEIPAGEYGGGAVSIWDAGTYSAEKWRDDEVIATLQGRQGGGLAGEPIRVALIRTGRGRAKSGADTTGAGSTVGVSTGGGSPSGDSKSGEQWLIHRMALLRDGDDAGGHGSHRHRPEHAVEEPKDAAVHTPRPMLASAAPASGPDPAGRWSMEMKWDGIRAIVVVEDGAVRLTSRNDNDLTATYPELDALAAAVGPGRTVLDGEIVAPDERGRPSFSRLQQRMGLTRPEDVAAARRRQAVRLLLFDVLEAEGGSLVDAPYEERRAVLARLVRPTGPIDVPPAVGEGTGDALAGALEAAMRVSRDLGLEGVVAKRCEAPYAAGRRSSDWQKLKHERAQEVVIGGWRPGSGRRADGVGSLLLGLPGTDGLTYIGRVGTGFSDRELDEVASRLRPLARTTSPFLDVPSADSRDASWVSPSLVGEVRFAEWTDTGRLRQASWRGWRPDKDAAEVRRES